MAKKSYISGVEFQSHFLGQKHLQKYQQLIEEEWMTW